MSTEEQTKQKIILAERLGWEYISQYTGSYWVSPDKEDAVKDSDNLPDYRHDLNAMHDVEKTLYERDFFLYTVYIDTLTKICSGSHKMSAYRESATASQRVEAFLSTLNL